MAKKDSKLPFRKLTADAMKLANGVTGMVSGVAQEVLKKGRNDSSSEVSSGLDKQVKALTAAVAILDERVKLLEKGRTSIEKAAKKKTAAKKTPGKRGPGRPRKAPEQGATPASAPTEPARSS